MLQDSVIAVRDSLKKDNRPFKLFFDNAQIVDSMVDVISWNDDLKVIHVIRICEDPAMQKHNTTEVMTFGYEDIRSISFYTKTEEITDCMTALAEIGATEYNANRAAKIEKFYNNKFKEQLPSMY